MSDDYEFDIKQETDDQTYHTKVFKPKREHLDEGESPGYYIAVEKGGSPYVGYSPDKDDIGPFVKRKNADAAAQALLAALNAPEEIEARVAAAKAREDAFHAKCEVEEKKLRRELKKKLRDGGHLDQLQKGDTIIVPMSSGDWWRRRARYNYYVCSWDGRKLQTLWNDQSMSEAVTSAREECKGRILSINANSGKLSVERRGPKSDRQYREAYRIKKTEAHWSGERNRETSMTHLGTFDTWDEAQARLDQHKDELAEGLLQRSEQRVEDAKERAQEDSYYKDELASAKQRLKDYKTDREMLRRDAMRGCSYRIDTVRVPVKKKDLVSV